MSLIHKLIRVEGRVQGVGFRWWTRQQAEKLGIHGSVKNLPDGSVEVFAIGTDAQLQQLETLLMDGPPSARVTKVSSALSPPGTATGFTAD